jgi:hypothetical protein
MSMEETEDYKVELLLDGKKVGLNPYVRSVFIGVATALVGTLKGIEEPKKIVLTVEKKSPRHDVQ